MASESSLANGDSREFWDGARHGRLLVQRCRSCAVHQFPPRQHCAACWDGELEWVQSEGTGHVESFTVVRRAPIAAFRDKVPYVVAAVRLDEGPRMIAGLVGDDALGVRIGDAVRVDFPYAGADADGGEVLPRFRKV